MLLFLLAGTACRVTPCCATFFSYGVRAISIFFQPTQFLGAATAAAADGEMCVFIFISPFHLFADYPAGQLRNPLAACLPHSSAPPPPPCSRCGRPVSAKPIGKQRPKMYFPVPFPSLTSKHSNGSRKNTMRPQFLLTMISIALAATFSAAKI